MVITGSNISNQRAKGVEWCTMTRYSLTIHILPYLMQRNMAGPLHEYLHISIPSSQDQFAQCIQLGKLSRKNFTFYMMPGEASQSGGVTYYSVHKDDLTALLQAEFNPYGDPISSEDLMAEELSNTTESDTKPQTFDTLAVEQSGEVSTEEDE